MQSIKIPAIILHIVSVSIDININLLLDVALFSARIAKNPTMIEAQQQIKTGIINPTIPPKEPIVIFDKNPTRIPKVTTTQMDKIIVEIIKTLDAVFI